MTSLKQDLPHVIPFNKTVATDEALPNYIASDRLPDTGSEQCVKMTLGRMEYGNCTADTGASVLCVNFMTGTFDPT
jgi:hypothetical protein